MESEGGYKGPPRSEWPPDLLRIMDWVRDVTGSSGVTEAEAAAIADGEPYCFRCGKPASSFSEYEIGAESEGLANAWQYVLQEEGTYNDDTNRFACDACYIALGMPAAPGGWRAP